MNEEYQEGKNLSANSDENAQSSISLEEELSLEVKPKEDFDSLRARLAKAEEEREIYKRGMFKYKNIAKGEEGDESEEQAQEEEPKENVREVALKVATEVLERNNERSAINQFTDKYPALKEPSVWAKVVANYTPRAGKGSVDSVKQDLEAALILAKHYGGGKVAEKEISLNRYASVSYAGSIAQHDDTPELSETALGMARAMGKSVEQLKSASQPGANVIHLS